MKGKFCPKSHDIDLIIDIDEFCMDRKSRKRKRRKQNQQMRNPRSNKDSSDMEAKWDRNSESIEMNIGEADGADFEDIENKTDKMELDARITDHIDTVQNGAKVDTHGDAKKMCQNCGKAADATLSGGGHRAGYDAFMTGLIYAVYLTTMEEVERDRKVGEWKNKLYLSGKDYPLSVSKSNFVKQTKEHLEKIAGIRRINTVKS